MAPWAAMGTPTQERLGRLIKERRESRGIYTVSEAARLSGLSRDTWSNVEDGEPAKPVTYRKVEDTLRWTHGSCGAVLAGGDPTPLPNGAPTEEQRLTERVRWLEEQVDIMRAVLDDLERGNDRNAS